MRLSIEHNTEPLGTRALVAADPTAPDLGFLTRDFATGLRSFLETIDRMTADNPVVPGPSR